MPPNILKPGDIVEYISRHKEICVAKIIGIDDLYFSFRVLTADGKPYNVECRCSKDTWDASQFQIRLQLVK